MVQQVERLGAHLQRGPSGQRQPPADGEIDVAVAWPAHGIPRRIAHRELRCHGKRGGVEPGDGGWMTFNRSHRQSKPAFTVWRPLTQVSVSAISLTLVRKSAAVLMGDPSC